MMIKLKLIAYLCLLHTIAFAQTYKSGINILSFHSDVDDTEQNYACYVPQNYNSANKYPLVVMLHGAGSNARLALRRVFGNSNAADENDVEASLKFPEVQNSDYIVVAPNCRGTVGYQGISEKDVWDMMSDVKSRFLIDENRTYLTGLSMGGGGTLWLGLTHPDVWAAIAPVCPAPPANAIAYLLNANILPTHFFQGGSDPVVKPEGTRKWVEDFKNVGANVQYVEFPNVGHDAWVKAYQNQFIFEWFKNYKRNPYPDSINFTCQQLKYGKVFWATIEDSEFASTSTLKAKFESKNILNLKVDNITKIHFDLKNHPKRDVKGELVISIDNQKVTTQKADLDLIKINNTWQIESAKEIGIRKNSHIEGPLLEAFNDRHIYVYGTADKPDKIVLAKRKKIAETAADWSYYRGEFLGRAMIFPRVLADAEIRESDIARSNLILFGNKSTNSYIKTLSLPIELSENADDSTSLVFIYPNKNHYVVVNSGMPFWNIPEKNAGSFGRMVNPSKAASLSNYGDIVLYDDKTTLNLNFDSNWKINTDAKNILSKSKKIILN